MKAGCEARLMALILLFFCFYGFEISDAKVLITEVYADTLMKGEPDEFIVLENFGDSAVNLEGWSISDGEGEIIFPDFVVQPHQKVYVVREAEAFERQALDFGVAVRADFEYEDSSEEVPNLEEGGVSPCGTRAMRSFCGTNTGKSLTQSYTEMRKSTATLGKALHFSDLLRAWYSSVKVAKTRTRGGIGCFSGFTHHILMQKDSIAWKQLLSSLLIAVLKLFAMN